MVAYRGEVAEDRHRLSVAVVDPSGKLLLRHGNPERVTLLRSTAKPFQVQPLLLGDAARHFGIGDEEIALACASHTGEARHTDRVLAFLARSGLGAKDLDCGAHAPAEPVHRQLIKEGRLPESVHNNCSGKHAAMLVTALARGWPTRGYLDPEHPLQQEIRGVLAELAAVADFPRAIDGCSAPTYGLALSAMARMFALLLAPESAPARLQPGLTRARDAMRRFPELVGGEGVIDTTLMQHLPGLVAKRGAAAAYTLAVTTRALGPVGVALKVEDGSNEARECAVLRVLEWLEVDGARAPELAAQLMPVRRNCRGLEVGRIEAEFDLVPA